MKLVSNKSENLFCYFPEVGLKQDWTAGNPCFLVGDRIHILPWTASAVGSRRWFLFRAVGGTSYRISAEWTDADECLLAVRLFRYLGYGLVQDIQTMQLVETGLVDEGEVGKMEGNPNRVFDFSVPDTCIVLGSVNPLLDSNQHVLYYSPGTPVSLVFTVMPEGTPASFKDFDKSAHVTREWASAIDGSCWNLAGKIYRHRSLDEMGRRLEAN